MFFRLLLLFMVFSTASLPALAGETATGDQITRAISGNTVEGTWHETSPYSTYFAPDGALRGTNGGGKWFVLNDSLCFQSDEVNVSCWQVEIAGPFVAWVNQGEVLGSGAIVSGNPRGH